MTPHELFKARQALGVSAAKLAKALGVGLRTYHGWEGGDRDPPRMAELLLGLAIKDAAVRRGMGLGDSRSDFVVRKWPKRKQPEAEVRS